MKKVSVIVPVYNTKKYLQRCLGSLVNQALKDIEIIAIDDCSTDGSSKILDEYDKKYKSIRVIHNKENKGIGYNRNLGIKEAKGKYISFVDSDDWISHEMLEKMYSRLEQDDLDVVVCGYHKMLEKGDKLLEIDSDFKAPNFNIISLETNPELLLQINLAPWNKLYKKELIESIKFPEDLKYEDALFTIKVIAKAKRIGFIDEKFNYYLVRSASETTVVDKRVFDIIKIHKSIIDVLKQLPYYDNVYVYAEAFTVNNLLRYTLQQKYQKNKIIANEFIDAVFVYLDAEFPNWKRNKIRKKRNFFKKMIEQNIVLTKIYCHL